MGVTEAGLTAACATLALAFGYVLVLVRDLGRLVTAERPQKTDVPLWSIVTGDRQAANDLWASNGAQLTAIAERLTRLERTRPRVVLDTDQREELKVMWPSIACQSCGLAHPGICPRVKTQTEDATLDQGGRVLSTRTTVEYWPNDQWQPPAGAVSSEDVWGHPIPTPPAEAAASNGNVSG